MGRDKASLPLPSGRSFVQHAVDRLRVVCNQVVVSTAPDQFPPGLETVGQVIDPVSHQGPIIGVATCLDYAREHGFAGCLCTPVDMPGLTAEDLHRIRDAWIDSPDQLVVAIDAISGQLEPLVAVYPTRFADDLGESAVSLDRSLVRWIERQSPMRVALPPRACSNVNTPDDL